MSYDVQGGGDLVVERTVDIPSLLIVGLHSNVDPLPSGFYVQAIGIMGVPGGVSNVKIKRPDGTWATVFQIEGVHLYYDGAWHVL